MLEEADKPVEKHGTLSIDATAMPEEEGKYVKRLVESSGAATGNDSKTSVLPKKDNKKKTWQEACIIRHGQWQHTNVCPGRG